MIPLSKLPKGVTKSCIWDNSHEDIWLSTSYIVSRNIAQSPFPAKLTKTSSKLLNTKIKKAIKRSSTHFDWLCRSALSAQDVEYIHEHFLYSLNPFPNKCHEEFGFSKDGKTCIHLQGEDHITFLKTSATPPFGKPLKTIFDIEREIHSALPLAYTREAGYITSDFAKMRTGLTIEIHLHVPALLQSASIQHIQALVGESLTIRGISLGPDTPYDLIVLTNTHSSYMSYETVLEITHEAAQKIRRKEKDMRLQLKNKTIKHVKKEVSVALTALKNKETLDTREALSILSKVRFGSNLGILQGVTQAAFNEFFFTCRRSHMHELAAQQGKKLAINLLRAQETKKLLEKASIVVT